MSNTIDRETVIQVARLARLQIPNTEAADIQAKLSEIIAFVSQLSDLEVDESTEPFFGALESVNAIRQDEVKPSMERSEVLSNAPDTDGEFYLVPPVFKS